MLARFAASGVTRGMVPVRPSQIRLFGVKSSDVFDKEANKEQMLQVTKQMEDAMLKEKDDVQNSQKVPKMDSAWNPDTETVEKQEKKLEETKSQEMNAIFDEQVKQANEGTLHGQGKNFSYKDDKPMSDQSNMTGSKNESMMDKVKHKLQDVSKSMTQIMGPGAVPGDDGYLGKMKIFSDDDGLVGKMNNPKDGDGLVGKVKSTVQETSRTMGQGVKQTLDAAATSMAGMGQGMKQTVTGLGAGVVQTVSGMGEGVKQTVENTATTMKDMGRGTQETMHEASEALKDLRKGVADTRQAISLDGVGEGTRRTMRDASSNMRGFGEDLREVTKKSMEDLTEMAKGVMASPHPLGEVGNQPLGEDSRNKEDAVTNDLRATQADDPQAQKDKQREGKNKFAEKRENSSLL